MNTRVAWKVLKRAGRGAKYRQSTLCRALKRVDRHERRHTKNFFGHIVEYLGEAGFAALQFELAMDKIQREMGAK